ncbi:hypothetical protein [Flavobacterium wongokense]|uniref:hypothetical protein n=1 Tax=Flavobacterium wongokense TaxID=2910674 RepID=UPI001F46408E|nr:hypothetical protein [Flavobacterium sp. WG47]MCF6133464.1 hypothetical protein [Flavobacterium sp. WG47]
MKLTEDETIKLLMQYLESNNWKIESHCLGQTRGCDIVAVNGKGKLYIEVKGARAGNDSPTKRREFFDSGQIKTHFGKAIVKILDDKYKNPKSEFAIAHPNDSGIKKAIGNLTPYLKDLGIRHFWVSENGSVEED